MSISLALLALAAATEKPALDMTAFFTGRTHSDSVLKVAFHRAARLVIDSVGGKGDKGDFVMIDTVHEGDKPVRTRKWIMRPDGPNRMTGTLTDATSPVELLVAENSATIRYVMKGGLNIEQHLELLPDGKTLSNHVVAKKFGLKFARVDGTVRKLD